MSFVLYTNKPASFPSLTLTLHTLQPLATSTMLASLRSCASPLPLAFQTSYDKMSNNADLKQPPPIYIVRKIKPCASSIAKQVGVAAWLECWISHLGVAGLSPGRDNL